jgi:hypothetical protein
MNSEVKTILDTITIGEVAVPNALLYFDGVADTFVLYSPSNESVGLAGDDKPLALVEGWDIDIYSKNNYVELSKTIKKAFIDAGWVYRGSGVDTYDEATKLYHRLMEFSKEGDTSFLEEEA